jgi:RHS repeat-associated protein
MYPDGVTALAYAYDAANRLTQVTQGTLGWAFVYDGAGNRTQLTQPNGTQTVYSYLNNNWLSSIAHQNAAGPLLTIGYTYDANGNRITQADSSGTTTFSYDALNRLSQGIYPGTYGTWSWTYDGVGNRTSQTAPSGPTTYTYDGNNRLTQAGAAVYTYDAIGNLTGTSAGQSFTYDPFNRMTQAVGTGGTATYTYNGDGRKVQRVGPDGTTRYYYDGIRPIWETDGAGVMTAELDRDIFGNLLSRLDAHGPTRGYYHPDGLGSTLALTDATGTIVGAMLYDAWGNVRASGSDVGKYRFTGAELDAASGLYHMGARFYNPSIGRWLSEDPDQDKLGKVFNPLTLNFYAYVNNTPLNLVDRNGLNAAVAALSLGAGLALAPVPGLGEALIVGFLAYEAFSLVKAGVSNFQAENRLGRLREEFGRISASIKTDRDLQWVGNPDDPKDHRKKVEQARNRLENMRKSVENTLRGELRNELREKYQDLLNDIDKKLKEIEDALNKQTPP